MISEFFFTISKFCHLSYCAFRKYSPRMISKYNKKRVRISLVPLRRLPCVSSLPSVDSTVPRLAMCKLEPGAPDAPALTPRKENKLNHVSMISLPETIIPEGRRTGSIFRAEPDVGASRDLQASPIIFAAAAKRISPCKSVLL